MFWKCFLIFSACGPLVFLNTAKPSSLYKPMSFLMYMRESWWSIKIPTSSQTSAPSYTPIVTSNNPLSFLIQICCLLKSRDFLACLMMALSPLASYDSMDWNIWCKVSWNYWNFWRLWQPGLLKLWRRLTEASSISINFKTRCILCDVYNTQVFTIIHVNTFHESKGHFPVLVLWHHLK